MNTLTSQYHVHFEAAKIPKLKRLSYRELWQNACDTNHKERLKQDPMVQFLQEYSNLIHKAPNIESIFLDFEAYLRYEHLESNIIAHTVFIDLEELPERFDISVKEYAQLLLDFKKSQKLNGFEINWVPCILRQLFLEKAYKVLNFVESFGQQYEIHQIGLAGGPEKEYPINHFKSVLEEAKSAGIELVLHAGEESGTANQVLEALDLGVLRIGHGVQIFDGKNQRIIDRVKEQGVTLDLCPISNETLGFVNAFPAREVLESGVKFTLNADDPCIFNCTVKDNKDLFLRRARGLTRGEGVIESR